MSIEITKLKHREKQINNNNKKNRESKHLNWNARKRKENETGEIFEETVIKFFQKQ